MLDACKSGLLEREIEEILERLHQKPTQNAKQTLLSQTPHEEHDRCIHQKEIDKEDVCPICQEELLKKMLPITYCRLSAPFILCLAIYMYIYNYRIGVTRSTNTVTINTQLRVSDCYCSPFPILKI